MASASPTAATIGLNVQPLGSIRQHNTLRASPASAWASPSIELPSGPMGEGNVEPAHNDFPSFPGGQR